MERQSSHLSLDAPPLLSLVAVFQKANPLPIFPQMYLRGPSLTISRAKRLLYVAVDHARTMIRKNRVFSVRWTRLLLEV
jgi:hypothetical protein